MSRFNARVALLCIILTMSFESEISDTNEEIVDMDVSARDEVKN